MIAKEGRSINPILQSHSRSFKIHLSFVRKVVCWVWNQEISLMLDFECLHPISVIRLINYFTSLIALLSIHPSVYCVFFCCLPFLEHRVSLMKHNNNGASILAYFLSLFFGKIIAGFHYRNDFFKIAAEITIRITKYKHYKKRFFWLTYFLKVIAKKLIKKLRIQPSNPKCYNGKFR
jgi:hypothetical protein